MLYRLMLNLLSLPLLQGQFQAPRIQPHQSMRLSLLQIIMVILMSILFLDWVSQPMDQLLPTQRNVDGTVGGQSYTWTGLDLSTENKPVFTLTDSNSGNAFQFTETYRGPGGVSNVTTIQRNIESQSVITSTSVFSQ